MKDDTKLWMHFGNSAGDRYSFVKGVGNTLIDESGHELMDALSGLLCVQVGYGRSDIVQAMSSASMQLSFCSLFGNENPIVKALARKMSELAPAGFSTVFFTTGGSTAVETAIKIARRYQTLKGRSEKQMFASRLYSYHGSTLGASSVSGMNLIRDSYGKRMSIVKLFPPCNPYRCHHCSEASECTTRCLDVLRSRLQAEDLKTIQNQIAGVFVEPVQNGGGAIPATREYMRAVRELCDISDTLMISDETICSFGRLGTWYGCQYYDYTPDMIVVGKGLTSGYAPIGAVLISDKISREFEEQGASLAHGFTFGGHISACAAALENIRIIEEEMLLDHVKNVVESELRDGLNKLKDHPWVGDVRGAGAFWAVELTSDKLNKTPFRGEWTIPILARLSYELYRSGVYCRTDDRVEPTLTIAPQLITERNQLRVLIRKIRHCLDKVWEEYRHEFVNA